MFPKGGRIIVDPFDRGARVSDDALARPMVEVAEAYSFVSLQCRDDFQGSDLSGSVSQATQKSNVKSIASIPIRRMLSKDQRRSKAGRLPQRASTQKIGATGRT